jgi:hypothetical protein
MKLGRRLSGTCFLDPVGLSASTAPGVAVLLFQLNPASLQTAVSLAVLLAAVVTTAAGLAVTVGRLRLRPHPPPVQAPSVRAVPDPGPPGQLNVHSSGPAAARTMRVEPSPVAGITTIGEGPATPPAPPDRPSSALDLLFGPGSDTPEALAGQILSADAHGDLGRALENLPGATREAAIREATAAAARFMDVDLIGALVAGWRKHHDLTAAAQRTVAAPGGIELVHMAGHQITMTQHPSVIVLVDGLQVTTIRLGLSVVLTVNAMTAAISAGRLVALHSGCCDITATLAVQGISVLTGQTRLMLPGVIPLSPGIRLLTAGDYPVKAGQAESADDGHAQRIAPASEGTTQA